MTLSANDIVAAQNEAKFLARWYVLSWLIASILFGLGLAAGIAFLYAEASIESSWQSITRLTLVALIMIAIGARISLVSRIRRVIPSHRRKEVEFVEFVPWPVQTILLYPSVLIVKDRFLRAIPIAAIRSIQLSRWLAGKVLNITFQTPGGSETIRIWSRHARELQIKLSHLMSCEHRHSNDDDGCIVVDAP